MDSDKCKVLLTVLELKSITKTAKILDYTTSGISRMISSLEQEAGFSLIIRNRQGIEATKECIELLPIIRKLSYYGDQYKETVNKINGLETGEIVIGTSYHNYYLWFAKLIARFQDKYPSIKISILTENSTMLMSKLSSYDIDICLISRRDGKSHWIPLIENPMVAWLPKDHAKAHLESFPLEDFSKDAYISTFPDEQTDNSMLLASHNIVPNTKFTSTDSYATYCMVEAGLGIALDNGLIAEGWKGSVVIKPLDPPSSVSLGIAYLSEEVLSPSVRLFITFVKEYIK